MTEFFKRTETHFRFTWEALVSNRLAIHLLSSGSAMYDMVLRQYLHYYQNYDVTLDHFLTGLDALGTGRLTFQVLDPDELNRFLSTIRRQLREERSPFELAFNHTYQFYAEPMVMFTNTHDQLLVNVPILLRLTTQKPLNLYSIDTVPMPFDTETLDANNNEYTFINNSYPYMALNEHNYSAIHKAAGLTVHGRSETKHAITHARSCEKNGTGGCKITVPPSAFPYPFFSMQKKPPYRTTSWGRSVRRLCIVLCSYWMDFACDYA